MGTVQYINWELRALAEEPVKCRRPTKAEPRHLTPDEDELIVFFVGERTSV